MSADEGVTVDPTLLPGGGEGGAPSPAPAFVKTACPNSSCKQHGVEREIRLAYAAMGVLAVPQFLCAHCSFQLYVTWPGREENV